MHWQDLRFRPTGRREETERQPESLKRVCRVRRLSPKHPLREATFWHNLLFNPRLPADCLILGFEPDWPKSDAEPPAA